jgi:ATP-binding cassette subfamily C protein
LLGFEKPEAGAVYYDGQNLEGLDVQVVRRHIGVVLQSATLMNGNILRNISGSFDLPLETVWEAARLAGVDEDIRQMPMGMHTEISENGGGLSGGQRQRLLIARAIVRRPRILFFDEATSALDNRTQAIVSRSIETLAATRFVVAHRLSTIVNADRIFVLEKGRLVQTGTYSELISQEGSFRDLARRQLA